jgi:hypothetical protein
VNHATLELVKYIGSVLRLMSIPAGALELLPDPKREAIETWLWDTSRKGLIALCVSVPIFYLTILILTYFAPYVVMIVVAVSTSGITGLIVLAFFSELFKKPWGKLLTLVVVASIMAGVFSPASWLIKLGMPLEIFLHWLPKSRVLDVLIPAYSGDAFLAQFNSGVESVRGWLWHWLAWLNSIYFFLAKALIVLVIVVLELSFVVVILAICLLPIVLSAYVFLRLSNALKVAIGITNKGRLPVGAFVVVATGELLDFVAESFTLFQGAPKT